MPALGRSSAEFLTVLRVFTSVRLIMYGLLIANMVRKECASWEKQFGLNITHPQLLGYLPANYRDGETEIVFFVFIWGITFHSDSHCSAGSLRTEGTGAAGKAESWGNRGCHCRAGARELAPACRSNFPYTSAANTRL